MHYTYKEKAGNFLYILIRMITWTPVFFMLLILFWSFYVFVFKICFHWDGTLLSQIILLTSYMFFFTMVFWSLWKSCCPKKMPIPDKFYPSKETCDKLKSASCKEYREILEDFSVHLPLYNIKWNGLIRYCRKCRCVKPDRCHHCSTCNSCVLRMDHHCPWINGCVNISNYKYFLLFIFYIQLYSIYLLVTVFPIYQQYGFAPVSSVNSDKLQQVLLFILAGFFEIGFLALFLYHCYLVSHNMTTLENMQRPFFKPSSRGISYDLGKEQNFKEIFGDNPLFWAIPVYTTKGDGITFKIKTLDHDVLSV